MMTFCPISNRFGEPISRAAKGASYDDGEALEIMRFQIDQWVKRASNEQIFVKPTLWSLGSEAGTLPWTILVYLWANSVRGMLLRPLFLPETSTPASKRSIQPALEIISGTIDILSVLDRTTDIYRKWHGHFHPLLASACALLCLLVTYASQEWADVSNDFPYDFPNAVNRCFEKAMTMAAAHSGLSRASRRLWKRLDLTKTPLRRLGVLFCSEGQREILTTAVAQQTGIVVGVSATCGQESTLPSADYWEGNLDEQSFYDVEGLLNGIESGVPPTFGGGPNGDTTGVFNYDWSISETAAPL
jgi:hypothetical protein